MPYIHEQHEWPRFRWSDSVISTPLASVRHKQGRLIGQMGAMGFDLQSEAMLATLTEDVVRSSEIEGEQLDRQQVRSSVARHMGLDIGAMSPIDRTIEGVVDMLLDATQNHALPLTEARLFDWHAALFPTGRSGMTRIVVGAWRDGSAGPMQVVSGPYGRERVHFEAPAADRMPAEMRAFLAWFEAPAGIDPVLAAAIAHLWFVTIHPFDDGNGRIARAIADMALARSEGSPRRFYSMSAEIRHARKAYYEALERTQRGSLDITDWILWFLACLDRAITGAEQILDKVLAKATFWRGLDGEPLNERQRAMLNRLLDGFEGKLTSSKWAKLCKVSPDTALRDINDLVARGVLVKDEGGGRSTSYVLRTN